MGGHDPEIAGSAGPEPGSALRRRRDELAEQVAELQWNLGGLTYEMAIRDHFRLDVLMRRAAMLQERDGELAEVKRLLHMEESSIVGTCASCGAVRSRGAVFCWQCGARVMDRIGGGDGGDGSTEPTERLERDASTVELVAPGVREEVNRATAQPAQAPVVEPQAGEDPRDSAAIAAPSDASELGRPVQAGS
ncbi:MAG TPA: hypothetical protein VNX67_06150 [Solirubrobacteraceae bacterium]|nr:hypothetical protein [Solirubrobacteraceae bacterium]